MGLKDFNKYTLALTYQPTNVYSQPKSSSSVLYTLSNKSKIKIIEPGDDTKFKRINITMPESIINAIDKITNNRSAWLSDTARRALSL